MSTITSSLLCNNFGGINRINSSFSPLGITASDMQNVELFDTGLNSGVGIRTMKGNTAVLSLLDDDEKIIDIYESVQNSQIYCFLYVEDETEGKIYSYDIVSKDLSLKVDGLSLTGVSCGVDFAQGWDDLFIFSNGEDLLSIQVGKLDQFGEPDEITIINTTDVEGADVKGLGLVVYDGRLWIFNGTRLVYSVKENCYDFSTSDPAISTSAGFIEFVKKITAIIPYLGSLAIFHKDSSELLSLNSDYSYSVSEESPGGCAGIRALVFHGNQLFFYDNTKKAVFAFSQIISGEKTLSDNLAKDVQDELFNIASDEMSNIKMISVVQSDRNEVWMLIPSDNQEESLILIFDYIHSQWVKRKSQKLNALSVLSDNLYSASDNNLLLEYSGDSFDSKFIESFYKCSPLNLSVDNSIKVLYIPPRVTLDMTHKNKFWVKYVKEYDSINKVRKKEIVTKNIKNVLYWDSSYWDGDDIFQPKENNAIKRLPTATFKTLEITFFTSAESSNQGFSIINIELSNIKVKQL